MRTFLALLLGGATAVSAQPRPRVHIVATGGTIASTNYYGGNQGKIGIDVLLKSVPAIDTVATITGEQFANVSSAQVTPAMWLRLARSISDTLKAHADITGVVVTHGTDTLEETAYFLDLTVGDPRPVIVTGAMRPSDGVGIDGPANLLASVRVAANATARDRGTMVVLNDEIMAARDATKMNTVRPNAFAAPYRGDLGVADPERVAFHREPRHVPVFDLANVTELPRVDVVYAYSGADGTAIDAFVAAGAKGIVVGGVGRGGTTSGMREALDRARTKGVVIVTSSRAGSGSVPVGSGASRAGAPGPVGAGDLSVSHARVLLMLALTRTSDPREIAKVFLEHQ